MGFKKKELIKPYFHIRPAQFIYPDESVSFPEPLSGLINTSDFYIIMDKGMCITEFVFLQLINYRPCLRQQSPGDYLYQVLLLAWCVNHCISMHHCTFQLSILNLWVCTEISSSYWLCIRLIFWKGRGQNSAKLPFTCKDLKIFSNFLHGELDLKPGIYLQVTLSSSNYCKDIFHVPRCRRIVRNLGHHCLNIGIASIVLWKFSCYTIASVLSKFGEYLSQRFS